MTQEFRGKNVTLFPNGAIRFFDWMGRAVDDDYWELTHVPTGESGVYRADHNLLDLSQELMRIEAAGKWDDIKDLEVVPLYGVMIYLAGYLDRQIAHPNEMNPGKVWYHHVYFPELKGLEFRGLFITPRANNLITVSGAAGVPLLP